MATIPDGSLTQTIYSQIRDQNYKEALALLKEQLFNQPNNRAGLSLSAYCSYHSHDFEYAAECYQKLSNLYPEVADYRFQLAVCLYKNGAYDEAMAASYQVDDENYAEKVKQLQASIHYTLEDLASANKLLSSMEENDPNNSSITINQGCILYKEKNYQKSLEKFQEVYKTIGYRPFLAYNIALCHYRMQQFALSLKSIADIIERGIKTYPELSVGMRTEGIDVRSVGNTTVLSESAFVEAFNLKAAIEYNLKNFKQAKEALTDMPPRSEEELDPVTLHNIALMNIDSDQQGAFEKMQFLVKNVDNSNLEELQEDNLDMQGLSRTLATRAGGRTAGGTTAGALRPTTGMVVFSDRLATAAANQDITVSCPMQPPEVLANYILLLIKFDDLSLASDTLAEFEPWANRYINSATREFIKAVLLREDAPQDCASRLEEIAQKKTKILRQLMKNVTEAKNNQQEDLYKLSLKNYEEEVDQYLPVLMAHARIYWDKKEYDAVESLFRRSVEFCNDQESWRINVAHTMFVQGNKFTEASNFYEPIVHQILSDPSASITDIEAVVLANLCVCYIMTSRNEQAESLMRTIEKEEEELAYNEPDRKLYHSCIVDLVIGTLYCSKGNFEFGLSRVIKSLEPYNKKLGPDTWYYAKRCLLSLIELLMQEMIVVPDETIKASIEFLHDMEAYGKDILARESAIIEKNENGESTIDPTNRISWEARQLKALLLAKTGWP